MKVKKNMVKMTGCVYLRSDALQVFRMIGLELEVLDILHHRCAVYSAGVVENRT